MKEVLLEFYKRNDVVDVKFINKGSYCMNDYLEMSDEKYDFVVIDKGRRFLFPFKDIVFVSSVRDLSELKKSQEFGGYKESILQQRNLKVLHKDKLIGLKDILNI
jgi:ABC-type metal ion transport system substrate-binding protein